jgi:hypothetical protein
MDAKDREIGATTHAHTMPYKKSLPKLLKRPPSPPLSPVGALFGNRETPKKTRPLLTALDGKKEGRCA